MARIRVTVPRVLVGVAIMALVSVLLVPESAANHEDENGQFPDSLVPVHGGPGAGCNESDANCRADDNVHSYYISNSLWNGAESATVDRMTRMGDATDLFVFRDEGPPVLSGPDETDVIFVQEFRVNDDVLATAICDDDSPGNDRCDQFYVTYNEWSISNQSTLLNQPKFKIRKFVACHEGGHTVGLVHGDQANAPIPNQDAVMRCMAKFLSINVVNWTFLGGAHNVGEINNEY